MGLVDYDSASDDELEFPASAPTKFTTTTKKPFQKLLSGGKIQVSLPATTTNSSTSDEPASKRPRIATPTNKFSGFNSFLPPPKNRTMKTPSSSSLGSASSEKQTGSISTQSRVGINLKTGVAPAWSRSSEDSSDDTSGQKGPEIPEGMKREEDVELKGNPLMFKPMSVVRKQQAAALAKRKNAAVALARGKAQREKEERERKENEGGGTGGAGGADTGVGEKDESDEKQDQPTHAMEPAKPVSLFSFAAEPSNTEEPEQSTGYTTMFENATPLYPTNVAVTAIAIAESSTPPQPSDPSSIAEVADNMNLSAAARRELFGRGRDASSFSSSKLVNFNMDREYAHNEELRAKGEEQVHNPLRAIQPGKHSLKQLVSQAQNNREALEESFAAGKSKRKEAGSRYGW